MPEFSYFDQFLDIEIDLTGLLNKISVENNLPKNYYTFSNNQPIVTNLKNLFEKFNLVFEFRDNIELISTYEIKDNQSIESVSYELYKDKSFWWIIALFNNIKNMYRDWPFTQNQLIVMATRLYEEEAKFSYDTYTSMLHDQNEERRNIIYPNSKTLKDIIAKYREAIINNG